MFIKAVSSLARFAPEKMGKTTLAEGATLFRRASTALNPARSTPRMRIRGRTNCTSFWKARAWCKSASRPKRCRRAMLLWRRPE